MSICLCTKSREKNSLLETFLTGWDWGRKQRKNKEKGRNVIYGKLVRKTLVLVWMRVPGDCPQPLQGPWAPAGWGWGHSLLPPRWPGSCWPLTLAAEGPRCPAPGGICSSVRVSAHLPCPAPRRCWQTCLWGLLWGQLLLRCCVLLEVTFLWFLSMRCILLTRCICSVWLG